jgi:23S rRNA (pseudouridine1915-N3)-methyltransferase
VLPKNSYAFPLDVRGESWNTEVLAAQIEKWHLLGRDAALMIGGPNGLALACIERADKLWWLSRLKVPHALISVIVIGQLYRAWTTICRHLYQRG